MAVVISYQTQSGLKQPQFITLHFCYSVVQNESHWTKIKMSEGLHPFLEASEENSFPCPSQQREAARVHWLMAPSSVFKDSTVGPSPSPAAISLVLSFDILFHF